MASVTLTSSTTLSARVIGMVLENTVDISVWREWCNFKSSPTNNVARSGSARSLLAVTSSTARSTSCHLLASTERRQSQVLCHCKRKQCHNYTIVPYATPLSTIGVRSQAQAFDREPRPCSLSSLPFAKLKPHHISRAHREELGAAPHGAMVSDVPAVLATTGTSPSR